MISDFVAAKMFIGACEVAISACDILISAGELRVIGHWLRSYRAIPINTSIGE